jgi:hypothetical protein
LRIREILATRNQYWYEYRKSLGLVQVSIAGIDMVSVDAKVLCRRYEKALKAWKDAKCSGE